MDLPDIESFLRARLAAPLPGPAAQWQFAPHPPLKTWQPDLEPPEARRAAALILIYPGAEGPSLPLTMRRDDLPQHPGQISLPGGGLDPGEDEAAAALREAHEEIGIDPRDVRLLGPLSPLWVIVSNFVVRPFVGVTDRRPDFRAAPEEVAALIEVPVHALRDPSRVGWHVRTRAGVDVRYPYFDVAGHQVWGATAMMLGEFRELFASS